MRWRAILLMGLLAGATALAEEKPPAREKEAEKKTEAVKPPPPLEKKKEEAPRPTFKPKETIPVDQGVDFPVDI